MSNDNKNNDPLQYYESKYGSGKYDYFKSLSDNRQNNDYQFSFIEHIKNNNELIDDDFISKLSELTIEDIIALKLESSAKSFKGKMFGLPIWKKSKYFIRETLLKFAISVSTTYRQASSIIGKFGNKKKFKDLLEKYGVQDLIANQKENDDRYK